MKILIDTNIIVDYFREDPIALNLMRRTLVTKEATISLITYAELIYGSYRAANPEKETERINNFLKDFSLEVVNLNIEIIKIYAELKYTLEKKGERLDDFDLLIAATAKHMSFTLITKNIKHFGRIRGLKLESR